MGFTRPTSKVSIRARAQEPTYKRRKYVIVLSPVFRRPPMISGDCWFGYEFNHPPLVPSHQQTQPEVQLTKWSGRAVSAQIFVALDTLRESINFDMYRPDIFGISSFIHKFRFYFRKPVGTYAGAR
jgi:hypothetical protein